MKASRKTMRGGTSAVEVVRVCSIAYKAVSGSMLAISMGMEPLRLLSSSALMGEGGEGVGKEEGVGGRRMWD